MIVVLNWLCDFWVFTLYSTHTTSNLRSSTVFWYKKRLHNLVSNKELSKVSNGLDSTRKLQTLLDSESILGRNQKFCFGCWVLKTLNLSLWVSQFDRNISPLSRLPAGFALLPRKPASPWEAIGPDFGRYQRNHQRCAGKSYFILKVHTAVQFLAWNLKKGLKSEKALEILKRVRN